MTAGNSPPGPPGARHDCPIVFLNPMFKGKICLLGSFGVGKTSLVARFILWEFTDKYHTTVGVKVDKKVMPVNGEEVTLVIWDMAGEEDSAPVKLNQLRDAVGYLLVIDGTRSGTLEVACDIQRRVETEIGKRPFLALINKSDLREDWEIPDSAWEDLAAKGWRLLETSAKTGEHVEEAFLTLASLLLKARDENASAEDDG
jgi:small GTP-binding protein